MKRAVPVVGALGCLGVVGPLVAPPPLALLWNTTASVPVGLYRLVADPSPAVGDLVAARPPTALARWLDHQGFVPVGVPLLKTIAALPPSVVCRRGLTVTVDGSPVGLALPRDRRGRPLPTWNGCRSLHSTDIFVLNRAAGSLDSRYFGPLSRTAILGRAIPLLLTAERR